MIINYSDILHSNILILYYQIHDDKDKIIIVNLPQSRKVDKHIKSSKFISQALPPLVPTMLNTKKDSHLLKSKTSSLPKTDFAS